MKWIKDFLVRFSRPYFYFIWFFTSFYCLLAYVPFTYRQVLGIQLLPWLNTLADMQPFILISAVLLLMGSIFKIEKKDDLAPEDRRELFFLLGFSIFLTVWNLPKRLENNWLSLVFSFACLLPVFWLSFFDLRNTTRLKTKSEPSWILILTGLITGFIVSITIGLAYDGIKLELIVPGVNLTLLSVIVLCFAEQFFRQVNFNLEKKFRGYALTLGLVISAFLFFKVCAAISFFGAGAALWSLFFGMALGFAFAGYSMQNIMRQKDLEQLTETPGLFVFAKGLHLAGFSKYLYWGFWPIWIILIYCIGNFIPALDWNGLVQQLLCAFLLVTCFFQVYLQISRWLYRKLDDKILTTALVALAAGYCLVALFIQSKKIQKIQTPNPLFSIAKSTLFTGERNNDFYHFLQSRMNLSSDIKINLADIPLFAPKAEPKFGKPNIFIFVVDSLRRDYLQPYNSDINFTPQINKFASESFVFKNAFTRYGATGLSEPSIWAGRTLPHKMYPKPFAPVNSLEKLLIAEHYKTWISRDSILSEILTSTASNEDLDFGVSTQQLDLCRSSREIIDRLASAAQNSSPVFTYSQAQNIHVSVLAHKKLVNTETKKYDNFNALYASELEKVDSCFGEFIAGLKRLNLFEKSIVVLTADHGDSLGEEGRYGHAYTIYPEIMRIPLLISIPKSYQSIVEANTDRLVFSTDITATLQYFLNREEKIDHWSMGQSLFIDKGSQYTPRLEQQHLLMSSYGPVAGLLSADGKSIYISDAVNFVDNLYTINEKGASNEGVNLSLKNENETILREKIVDLYNHFNIQF